jgi:hypothetical protein
MDHTITNWINWNLVFPQGSSYEDNKRVIESYVDKYCVALAVSTPFREFKPEFIWPDKPDANGGCTLEVVLAYCVDCDPLKVKATIDPDVSAAPDLKRSRDYGGIATTTSVSGSIQSMQTGPTPPPPPKPSA